MTDRAVIELVVGSLLFLGSLVSLVISHCRFTFYILYKSYIISSSDELRVPFLGFGGGHARAHRQCLPRLPDPLRPLPRLQSPP